MKSTFHVYTLNKQDMAQTLFHLEFQQQKNNCSPKYDYSFTSFLGLCSYVPLFMMPSFTTLFGTSVILLSDLLFSLVSLPQLTTYYTYSFIYYYIPHQNVSFMQVEAYICIILICISRTQNKACICSLLIHWMNEQIVSSTLEPRISHQDNLRWWLNT